MILLGIYLFLLIELTVVCYIDLRHKKIPNIWPLLNIVIFILLLILFPNDYKLIHHGRLNIDQFVYSIVFLVVGFMLFVLRIMGAGDSKFLFSIFLIIPAGVQEKAFLHLLYSTLLIGSFVLLINLMSHLDVLLKAFREGQFSAIKYAMGSKFAYAPVILLAWIWLGWEINVF